MAPPTRLTCPDCITEGNDRPQPPEAFYWYRVKGWRTKRRSAYCKDHMKARAGALRRARLDPTSPDYDPAFRARLNATCRRYRARRKITMAGDSHPAPDTPPTN